MASARRRLRRAAAWLLHRAAMALAVCLTIAWRRSCRRTAINDPRPRLRAKGTRYVYALLHEHQLAAVLANDEPRLAAMVSRSRDGDVLAAALAATGVVAVRGSSRRDARPKGGLEALAHLTEAVEAGLPALLAVDGPRGPRGRVRAGVIQLARATNAVILPVAVTASRSWRLRRTWDQTLVPRPFAKVCLLFGEPIVLSPEPKRSDSPAGERVQEALRALALCTHPTDGQHLLS